MKPILICTLIVIAASLTVIGISPAAAERGTGGVFGGEQISRMPESHQEVENAIFFAVLEGLYNDGVDTETAKLLTTVDEKSGAPRYFVYGCPICMPAFNAVRVYVNRPGFAGDKQSRDTFGPGLSDVTRAQLEIDDPKVRVEAFQALILRWVDSYTSKMRLTSAEHEIWSGYISDMREKGNAILEQYLRSDHSFAEAYQGWEKCPVCEGSNGAMQP